MGCFNTILVPCPKCGTNEEAQTKSGDCTMAIYKLGEAPVADMLGVNTWAPFRCEKCNTLFEVDFTVAVTFCHVVVSQGATKSGFEE